MTSTNAQVTILVDNQAGEGLVAEHGLSLWVETEDKHILFTRGKEARSKTTPEYLASTWARPISLC